MTKTQRVNESPAAIIDSGGKVALANESLNVIPEKKKNTFANESLYRICTESVGILWGSSIYVATAQDYSRGSKNLLFLFSFLAILGLIWSLLAIKSQLEKRALQAYSLQRSRVLIACEFGWKMIFYGVIALIPAIAKELNVVNISFAEFINKHDRLLGGLAIHFFFAGVVIYFLKTEAEDERGE